MGKTFRRNSEDDWNRGNDYRYQNKKKDRRQDRQRARKSKNSFMDSGMNFKNVDNDKED